jgi:hypothetical protein
MPRGIPKPPGACERSGCYELAVATVRGWHDKTFGYRTWTIELCRTHALDYEYEPGEVRSAVNGTRTSWHEGNR